MREMPRDCIDTVWDFQTARPLGITGLLTAFADRVPMWQERARGRHLLKQLDDRMLRDIGLSPADVAQECAKHFWQR
jgi:uncharacterized protein YjiS (DUF1127 family)